MTAKLVTKGALMSKYDIDAIRKKIKASLSGRQQDPDEFRPDKAKDAQIPVSYRFFILPPYEAGDIVKSGGKQVKAARGLENQFYVTHGNHWVQEKPYACPRVWNGEKCDICDFGFQLMKDEKVKNNDEKRKAVIQQWMPNQAYCMNIYFPAVKQNPEDLHDRVMFYNAPKTVLDICMATLMRDDPGDPENPEAFGMFFDESNAFLFELQSLKQGRNNSYKTSKFLANPRPMARNQDNSPNEAAIRKILDSRHDLYSKIDVPDLEKIKRVYAILAHGDDSANDGKKGGGFDDDETGAKTRTAATTAKAPPAGKVDTGATVQKSAGTTTTRKAPPDDDDDVVTQQAQKKAKPPVADDLADEAPLPKEKPAPAAQAESANPEIDALIGQLEDDD